MDPYTLFSTYYDQMMSHIPYDKWLQWILEEVKKWDHQPEKVLDLACGTGQAALCFAKQGWSVTGVDLSIDMLIQAKDKSDAQGLPIQWVCQDMQALDLGDPVDTVVSMCDSLNYLPSKRALEETFQSVYNQLLDSGLFIFDMNTRRQYEAYGNQTFIDETDRYFYVWENTYDAHKKINTYQVTFFLKNQAGSYDKARETHMEYGYSFDFVKAALERSGFTLLSVYDDYKDQPINEETKRWVFLARKKQAY